MVNRKENALAVDLDGTLVLVDTLHEALVSAIRNNWLVILYLPIWLIRGKAYTKHKLTT